MQYGNKYSSILRKIETYHLDPCMDFDTWKIDFREHKLNDFLSRHQIRMTTSEALFDCLQYEIKRQAFTIIVLTIIEEEK